MIPLETETGWLLHDKTRCTVFYPGLIQAKTREKTVWLNELKVSPVIMWSEIRLDHNRLEYSTLLW